MKLANSQKKSKNIMTLLENQRIREPFNLDDQIEKLQMDLETIEFNYSRSAKQINKTIQKIDDSLRYSHVKTDEILQNCYDKIENNVLEKLVIQKERIIESNSLLKIYISQKSSVFKEMLKEQIISESEIINNADCMITKQTAQIREKIYKTFRGDNQNVPNNQQILKNMKQKMGSLMGELKKLEEINKTLQKKTQVELKQMMHIFQEIQDSRNDRQSKEEQLILFIEELSQENTIK